jgi:GH24 family phage-related lysozyme (muramidase)
MTYASVRSAAQEVAKRGNLTPHQLAAFSRLDESLSDEQRQEFTELWRAQGSPATAVPAGAWMAAAEKIVQEFEGCQLRAYPDLGTGGEPWTIGWGSTTINEKVVREGQSITQAQADNQLRIDLQRFHDALIRAIPLAGNLKPNQQAALVSWTYNVGVGAMQNSSLRKRLLDDQDPGKVASEELPRWDKANGKVLPGLTRRRAAEVALFVGQQLQQQSYGNPLQVPWYGQLDSATEHARRMCFSTSCAMLLQHLKPGTLSGPNGDDQYLTRLFKYGDTVDPRAQVRALSSYGIKATFTKVAGWRTIEDQIDKGIPVPCGYLHRGPVSAPSGGGHWLIVVGYTKTHIIVHDPLGEADLVSGATLSAVARFMKYTRKNFGPRWMVEGANTGWAIIAER